MAKLWTKPFVMIMAINFFIFLSFNLFNTSLPLYFQELGISESLTGICISIFTVGSLLVRPISGTILDRHGRKGVFLISLVLLTLLVFSYSFAKIFAAILLVRLLHGIDWSFASTSTSTLATDIIPRSMIGTGMGMFGLSMALSLAIGPMVGVPLTQTYGFATTIKLATAMLFVVLVLAVVFPFPTFTPPAKAPGSKSQGSFVEKTAVIPAMVMGCVTLTMSAVSTFVPLYAQELEVGNVGYFFSIYAIGLLISRFFIGNVLDHYGILFACLPCLLSMFGAMLLLAFAHGALALNAGGFLYGLGYGGIQTAVQSLAVMYAPPSRFGAANGTFFIGFDLGIGLGAILAGFLSESIGFSAMYLLLSGFILLATVLLVSYAKKGKNLTT